MKLILLACLLSMGALAQTALFTGNPEQRVEGGWQLGTIAAGDVTLETHFRIRNLGGAPAAVTFLRVAGTAFTLASQPPLPQTLAGGAWLDFQVNFAPPEQGFYSASVESDGFSVFLLATAVTAPSVWVRENAAWRALADGAGVDFGSVEHNAAAARSFVVENRTPEPLSASAVYVTGDGFRMAAGWPDAVLAPGESRSFEVLFAPQAAAPAAGALRVGLRHIPLVGMGLEAPLPRLRILLDLAAPASGRQGKITLPLAEVSHTKGEGELRLAFQPAVPGAQDPSVLFASGGRVAQFSIAEGDQAARFASGSSLGFQTGTTAGTILFTLRVGDYTEQESVTIPAAAVGITAARATREPSAVQVEVAGFDNTRSAAQLSFTFFDSSGTPIAPGAVKVEGAAAFKGYFASSDIAGAFLLRAVFPVTGSPEQVRAVEVEVSNSVGLTGTGRVLF